MPWNADWLRFRWWGFVYRYARTCYEVSTENAIGGWNIHGVFFRRSAAVKRAKGICGARVWVFGRDTIQKEEVPV